MKDAKKRRSSVPEMEKIVPFASHSSLQQQRKNALLELPAVLMVPADQVSTTTGASTTCAADEEEIKRLFPETYGQPFVHLKAGGAAAAAKEGGRALKVGVLLSGGQAPGGHNVITGLFDRIKRLSPDGVLIGFLDGPHGLFTGTYKEIDTDAIDSYRQQGGFDMIGSGRHKIETPEQFAASKECCDRLDLDGLIIIGGDDSNTNAALLAEYFAAHGAKTSVVGCPKTIDGDLKNDSVEVSFGFDTACKVYSELIGIIQTDAAASKKYWHFVRLMGRSASHITLECALQTHPNVVLIGEEIKENKSSLTSIANSLVDAVEQRAALGLNYGVVLLPEGLIEFVPELEVLVQEINEVLAAKMTDEDPEPYVSGKLSTPSQALFTFLPKTIRRQLLMDRDPHGNVQVARIETETLLIQLVQTLLQDRQQQRVQQQKKSSPKQAPINFRAQAHFFGYEGRAALPSLFDSVYCYSLGHTAAVLVQSGATGVMAAIKNLTGPVTGWQCGGAPVTAMLNVERRHGKNKPVIKKALVELEGRPFLLLQAVRPTWLQQDCYLSPGPIQFDGAGAKASTFTLRLEQMGTDAEADAMQGEMCKASGALTEARIAHKLVLPDQLKSLRSVAFTPHSAASSKTRAQLARPFLRKSFPHLTTLPSDAAGSGAGGGKSDDGGGQPLLSLLDRPVGPSPTVHKAKRVGVCFNGRQCPGGHTLVAGLHDSIKKLCPASTLIGFKGGTLGLFAQDTVVIDSDFLQGFRNMGGFHMLGRSVDMILTPEQQHKAMKACQDLKLDGLVLVGGPATNGDAFQFAEYLLKHGVDGCKVVGVPATVDRDFGGGRLETTLGFDTACRVYSQLIGNIATDMVSAKKYSYFVRLMGRSSSHIALECALQCQPNVVLINTEVIHESQSLSDIVSYLADVVCKRAALGRNYGLFVMSEGLIDALADTRLLIKEINGIFAFKGAASPSGPAEAVRSQLTPWSRALFDSLPQSIQDQLLLERESRGNVQLSQIETEKLLAEMVAQELGIRKAAGTFKGVFNAITHYLGYQGRSAFPSNFDCDLAYTQGAISTLLIDGGFTGYAANVRDVVRPTAEWQADPVPLALLMSEGGSTYQVEQSRQATAVDAGATVPPFVQPEEVQLTGASFRRLQALRPSWETGDAFKNPGPIQYGQGADSRSAVLEIEQQDAMQGTAEVQAQLTAIMDMCRTNRTPEVMLAAQTGLRSLNEILGML